MVKFPTNQIKFSAWDLWQFLLIFGSIHKVVKRSKCDEKWTQHSQIATMQEAGLVNNVSVHLQGIKYNFPIAYKAY